eukprot:gb/GECG01013034.1/.p1 GENE.gb/GECG01013034.1/~~gb/GECG01013034.1/.p1  ORF type:complete len:181 (+),score=22.00 gb/GECG01013034.1/:1-543(+)
MSKPKVANAPSFIEFKNLRFLIIDAPTDANVEAYLSEFKKHHVTDLVRACESHYSAERVQKSGVQVHDLVFDDGSAPPDHIIDTWLDICEKRFKKKQAAKDSQGNELGVMYSDPAVAVHCVAGLGRAPVLVAIALIEEGVEPLKAVNLIRDKRRGAINQKQLKYLEDSYKRRKKSSCTVM